MNRSHYWAGVVGMLALAGGPSVLAAQQRPSVELTAEVGQIPFQMLDNRVVFPGRLGDSRELHFVLDTGARATAVLGPIGDSLDLEFVGQARVGSGGGGVTAPVAIGETIELGQGVEVRNETVVALLEQDLQSRLGFQADGITGAALFTNSVVAVDFERGLISVHSELPDIPDRAAKIAVTVEDGGVPYAVLPVKLTNGETLDAKFVVDLGQGQSMALNVGADPAIEVPDNGLYVAGYGARIDGSEISGHFGRISTLGLGEFELADIVASFPDPEDQITRAQRHGSIGAEILRRFHVVFDYAAGFMYLTPNSFFDDAFEIDMSGLGLSVDEGAITVARVADGSPAADEGIQVGDRIVEIDAGAVDGTMLPEIRSLLRTHGRNVRLVVRRGDQRLESELMLRRRI